MDLTIRPRNAGETAKEFAYRVLRENICSMQLAPGDSLGDQEIAGLLGVSRTPVREAIYDLAKVSIILKNGDKAVDPYSPGMLRQVKAWRSLGGLRRYILFIDRHLRKYHED